MLWLWAVLLLIVLIVCWSLNLVGLPGNWINLAAVALYAWLMPAEQRVDVGWIVFGMLVALAVLGEMLEFLAGAAGATTAGGSRRGAALALIGAIVGGIVGLFVGLPLPIPVIGSVLASLLFSAGGALLGAMLGEHWKGRDLDESFRVGHAAFWGRLLGTLGKIVVGCVMIVVVAVGMVVQ